jgi:heme oxygenase
MIRQIEEENPYLLIAYIYHLNMGLFSGGQILKAKVGPYP